MNTARCGFNFFQVVKDPKTGKKKTEYLQSLSSYMSVGKPIFGAISGAAHETIAYYAIAVNWSGAIDTDNPTYTLDASITISQAFVA